MSKKGKRRRKRQTRRHRQFSVRVSALKVVVLALFHSIFPIAIGVVALLRILAGNTVLGIFLGLISCLVFYVFVYLWIREIGRTVLQFRADGLWYDNRLVPWKEISTVELVSRPKAADRLRLTLVSGQTLSISDDYFDERMDVLLHDIRARI